MAISFDYGPPPSALGALSYQAGAGQEAIRRRSEIEAMQMQAAKMRQQQQQAALDRQFSAWKTQYNHHSSLDKMQRDFKWREGQADKGHERNKEMFGLGNERKDFEWDRKVENDREMWEINKIEEERRDQRELQQDIDRRKQQAQERRDEYGIKKADDDQRINDSRRYRKLKPEGQAAIDKLDDEKAALERDVNLKPAHLDPDKISEKQKLLDEMRPRYDAIYNDRKYRIDTERQANSRKKHGIMIHERDAEGRLTIYQDPKASRDEARRHFEVTGDEITNPESIYTGDTPSYKEKGPYRNKQGELVRKEVHRGTDEKTGQSIWEAVEVPVEDPVKIKQEKQRAYWDARKELTKYAFEETTSYELADGTPTSKENPDKIEKKKTEIRPDIKRQYPGWSDEDIINNILASQGHIDPRVDQAASGGPGGVPGGAPAGAVVGAGIGGPGGPGVPGSAVNPAVPPEMGSIRTAVGGGHAGRDFEPWKAAMGAPVSDMGPQAAGQPYEMGQGAPVAPVYGQARPGSAGFWMDEMNRATGEKKALIQQAINERANSRFEQMSPETQAKLEQYYGGVLPGESDKRAREAWSQ